LVYIAEAHATDVWPLGSHVSLPSHKTLDDRIQAAKILQTKYHNKIPLLVDTMSDEFDEKYAIWPERYYTAYPSAGKIHSVFMPTTEFGFDHQTMFSLLQNLANPPKKVESNDNKESDKN